MPRQIPDSHGNRKLSSDPRSGAVRRHHPDEDVLQRAVKEAARLTLVPRMRRIGRSGRSRTAAYLKSGAIRSSRSVTIASAPQSNSTRAISGSLTVQQSSQ